jgi:membrane protein YdbS with pleckstrin-like domain
MEFIDNIATYYTTESRHGFYTSAITDIILFVLSILLFYVSQPASLLKGVAITVAIGSLVFIVGCYLAGNSAKTSLPHKIQSFNQNTIEFIKSEHKKVEEIDKNWTAIRIFWSVFLAVGIIIFFITSKPIWWGVAIGLLIFGTVGHIEEAISYQHNEKYRLQVNTTYSEFVNVNKLN